MTAATFGGLVATSAPASASDSDDAIAAFDMAIDLDADGVAHVTLDLDFDLDFDLDLDLDFDFDVGVIANHGPYLTWVVREPFEGERDRLYRFDELAATSPTAPADVATEDVTYQAPNGEVTARAFKIGSPDTTVTGVHHYTVTFDVEGWVSPADYAWPEPDEASATVRPDRGYDEFYVDLITGWDIPVRNATVSVHGPADVVDVACFDTWNETDTCDRVDARGATASFAQAEVLADDPLTIAIAYPRGTFAGVEPIVEYRWSVGRAFALTPAAVHVRGVDGARAGRPVQGRDRSRVVPA